MRAVGNSQEVNNAPPANEKQVEPKSNASAADAARFSAALNKSDQDDSSAAGPVDSATKKVPVSKLTGPGETQAQGDAQTARIDFTDKLNDAVAFFRDERVVRLPDGTNPDTANEQMEAHAKNVENSLIAAGNKLGALVNSKVRAEEFGFKLSDFERNQLAEVGKLHRDFMVDTAGETAQNALQHTKNVADQVTEEIQEGNDSRREQIFAIMGAVTSLVATPGAIPDLDDLKSSAVGGALTVAEVAGSNSKDVNELLMQDIVANDGVNGAKLTQGMIDQASSLNGNYKAFLSLLESEGLGNTSEEIKNTNAFSGEIMRRAAQESFAVSTLYELRKEHANIVDSTTDGRVFTPITRGNETGSAAAFAARDLEALGYGTQIPFEWGYKDGDVSITDTQSGETTYTKHGNANNFFIHNRDDASTGLPSAGLSIWDNGLDVSVNRQLDRVDDRWNSESPEQQMRDTLEWFALARGFTLTS